MQPAEEEEHKYMCSNVEVAIVWSARTSCRSGSMVHACGACGKGLGWIPSHEAEINTYSPASLIGHMGLGEAAPTMTQSMLPSCPEGEEGHQEGTTGQLPLARPALDIKGQVAPRWES